MWKVFDQKVIWRNRKKYLPALSSLPPSDYFPNRQEYFWRWQAGGEGKFLKKLWCCVGGGVVHEILKLTFRQSEY